MDKSHFDSPENVYFAIKNHWSNITINLKNMHKLKKYRDVTEQIKINIF